MFSGTDRSGRYLLLAGCLGVAVLLTVIAEYIEHSSQQHSALGVRPASAAGNTGNLVRK